MDTEIIIALISGGLIIMGVFLWKKAAYLVKYGKKTEAIIFKNNLKRATASKGGGLYFPVVRFTTETEEWITQELDIGYNPPKEEGEIVKILYDPDEPSYIQLDSVFVLVFLPRLLVPIGIVGLTCSLLIYLEWITIN